MLRHENATWWQGDREIFPEDVAYIRTFAKRFPGLSRTELTCTLCEHLDWLTPAGRPKRTACSKLLAQLARRVGDDWEARWGYRPLLLETFVDPARFRGSCYRAAGWALLGRTSGEGLVRPGKRYQTSPKLIFAKPLQADFRALLCSNQLKGTTEL